MLQLVSVSIRYALDRAAHARMKARFAADEETRKFWEDMSRKWRRLAETRGVVERVNSFLASAGASRHQASTHEAPAPGVPSEADCWAAAGIRPRDRSR